MQAILVHAKRMPWAFSWNGPIKREVLCRWLHQLGIRQDGIPEELLLFWSMTGGGNVFESETILGPFGDATLGEDLEGVNKALWYSGTPRHFLVFHTGSRMTAIDLRTQDYVLLDEDSTSVTRRFGSFDQWYEEVIARELAWRYRRATDEGGV